MTKRSLGSLALLAATLMALLATIPVSAQDVDPTGTPPTAEDDPEPTPTPSPTSTPASPLAVTSVEPKALVGDAGGTLSVYGAGFSSGNAVRLVGHGLLTTSYVNATALIAQVPAGVPAGVYDVEVSDAHQAVLLPDAINIIAPTPTPQPPAPESPPPPGRPILTIRNYALEPQQVRPGQEFVVTVEIYNNGSRAAENTLVIFPGDPFLPVGEPGHTIGQIHINHVVVVSQRMRAPASLSSGVFQLMVNLGANDWEGNHYDYPQPVPVEVVGGGGSSAPVGRPKVIVETATTEPPIVIPGEAFTLTLRLANDGSRSALNLFASVASSDIAVPAAGGGTLSLDGIAAGEAMTITLPLLLGDVGAGGRQILPISLEYSDGSGGAYTEQQNVGISVDTGLSRRPQLVISEYSSAPAFLTAGDTFTLTLRIANVGGGDAERLTLALGGDGGAQLEPFISLRAGNVIFVPAVRSGSAVEITRQLIIDGSADPKAYSLPIALAYDDARGSRQEDEQRLSLIVRRRPELQATFYKEPEGVSVGSPASLSVEMVNVGMGAVNVIELTASSPQMTVVAEGTPFLGPVEMGGAAPLDVTVTPGEAGTAELVISVVYRDDFNQPQVLTRTLTVEVASGQAPGGPPAPGAPAQTPGSQPAPSVWSRIGRVLKGFLGLGS